MPSSITEFRQRIYREVTLPSGLSVTIRKIQAWDFVGIGDLPIPSVTNPEGEVMATTENLDLLKRYTNRAIACGTVAPLMSDNPADQGSPDRLYVEELLPGDKEALALAILQWAGLVEETARAVDSFREESLRAPGESASGTVPLPAEHGLAADTGRIVSGSGPHLPESRGSEAPTEA